MLVYCGAELGRVAVSARTLRVQLEQEASSSLGDPYSLRQSEQVEVEAIRQALAPFNASVDEVFERKKFSEAEARKQFSGAELDTLNAILVTLGGGAVGGGFLKVCKDIIVKWLDNRAKRSVTVKLGNRSVKLNGSASKVQLNRLEALMKSFSDKPSTKAGPGKKARKVSGVRKNAAAGTKVRQKQRSRKS